MCKSTTKRDTLALPPTSGTPAPPGSPASAGTLSQIQPNQAPATGTAKITTMPLPANDGVTKDVREITFPRFGATGRPALEDVKQSPRFVLATKVTGLERRC